MGGLPRGGITAPADSTSKSETGDRKSLNRLMGTALPILLTAILVAACSGSASAPSPTTGGVALGPYQQIVRATCTRIHNDITDNPVQTTVNSSGQTTVPSAATIAFIRQLLNEERSEYSALFSRPVPQSLITTSKSAKQLTSKVIGLGTQEANELAQSLPQGQVTQSQVDQAVGPVLSQIDILRPKLNDTMTALAGNQCSVAP